MNRSVLNRTLLNTSVLCQSRLNQSGLASLCGKSGGIPSAIRRAMVLWYDIERQGCTNESMAENPVLKDLSGNGHDATCYNFGWKGMSGVGGFDYPLFSNMVSSDGFCNIPNDRYFTRLTDVSDTTYSIKFKVSKMSDGKTLYVRKVSNDGVTISLLSIITENGEYSFTIDSGYVAVYPSERSNPEGVYNADIDIQLVPLYPNALVSDGVDDYVSTGNITIPNNKFTILFDVDWLNTVGVNAGIVKSLSWWIYDRNSTNELIVLIKNGVQSITISNDIFGLSSNGNIYHIDSSITEYPYDMNITGVSNAINLATNNNRTLFTKMALRKFILFNRDLTSEEIEWVKTNLITA